MASRLASLFSDKGIDWGKVEKYDVGCKLDKLSPTVAKSDDDKEVNFPSEPSCESARRPDLSSVQQLNWIFATDQLSAKTQETNPMSRSPWKTFYGQKGRKTIAVVSFVLGVDCKVNNITVQT